MARSKTPWARRDILDNPSFAGSHLTLKNDNPDWLEIAVEVAGIDADLAADILRQACSGGVAIQSGSRFDQSSDSYVADGDAPALVCGYLQSTPDSERIRRSVRLAMQAAPLQRPPRWRRVRRLREESWRDSWKKHFGIQRHGRALVIKPSWTRYRLRGGDVVIEIDPGMAFGTGQHPTTAMCLRALEDRVRPGADVLDLGCGSGILAIAAAKLGARNVLALDLDPNAASATRENAVANGVADVVGVREGTLDVDDASFDVIVANLSGLTLERLAADLARSLGPGGSLITSGFLDDAVAGLSRAFEATGLTVAQVIDDGVWRAIIART